MSTKGIIINGTSFGDVVLMASHLVPKSMLVLLNQSHKIVYVGKVGDPIEDAECSSVVLSKEDYEDVIMTMEKLEK